MGTLGAQARLDRLRLHDTGHAFHGLGLKTGAGIQLPEVTDKYVHQAAKVGFHHCLAPPSSAGQRSAFTPRRGQCQTSNPGRRRDRFRDAQTLTDSDGGDPATNHKRGAIDLCRQPGRVHPRKGDAGEAKLR
ncbi:MAG TPA: hypothetical protein VGZ73_21555, partial [Bryobacteraceae bacterium]|nr:hypothetical protein [Bryobacteraceae bacterium]